MKRIAAGLVVLLFAASIFAAGPCLAGEAPRYLRIATPPGNSIYVQFQDNEMRLSATLDGLRTAAPVMAVSASPGPSSPDRFAQFPETVLPLPAGALPADVARVTLTLRRITADSAKTVSAVGGLKLYQADAGGQKRLYLQRINCPMRESGDAAPVVPLADLGKIKLGVETRVRDGNLGVAVKLLAGDVQLQGSQLDGKAADVSVRILDAAGQEVASKTGPLADFGFG